MKLKKDNVIKEIENKDLISLYLEAGWKVIKEEPKLKFPNDERKKVFNINKYETREKND